MIMYILYFNPRNIKNEKRKKKRVPSITHNRKKGETIKQKFNQPSTCTNVVM